MSADEKATPPNTIKLFFVLIPSHMTSGRIIVNPSHEAFEALVRDPCFIDKTGLIGEINRGFGNLTPFVFSAFPDGFGKTCAANMLAAYFSKGADSRELFSGLQIGRDPSFETKLNLFDVILIDMEQIHPDASAPGIRRLQQELCTEIRTAFPGEYAYDGPLVSALLADIYSKTGRRFYIIIDNWDLIFRRRLSTRAMKKNLLNFLSSVFDGGIASQYLVGSILTGVLPIRKFPNWPALRSFTEFTILSPGPMASYFGFNEYEVSGLCGKLGIDQSMLAERFGGYQVGRCRNVFPPYAVVAACREAMTGHEYDPPVSSFFLKDRLNRYLSLTKPPRVALRDLLSGKSVFVRTDSFLNDFSDLRSGDDVLTLMVHCGWLTFNPESSCVRIPNEGIRKAFLEALG